MLVSAVDVVVVVCEHVLVIGVELVVFVFWVALRDFFEDVFLWGSCAFEDQLFL